MTEYLAKVAWAAYPQKTGQPERQQWLHDRCHQLKHEPDAAVYRVRRSGPDPLAASIAVEARAHSSAPPQKTLAPMGFPAKLKIVAFVKNYFYK